MNRSFGCLILLVLVVSIAVFGPMPCWADTLTLDDGQVLKGSFKGIAGGKVQFEAFGNTMVFPAGKIKSLTLELNPKSLFFSINIKWSNSDITDCGLLNVTLISTSFILIEPFIINFFG